MSDEGNDDRLNQLIARSTDGVGLEKKIQRKRIFTSSFNPRNLQTNSYNQLYEHILVVGPPPIFNKTTNNQSTQDESTETYSDDGESTTKDEETKTKDEESVEPKILFIAPACPLLLHEDEFEHVLHFCFPNGIKPHGLKYTRSSMFISQFAFRLSGSTDDTYGFCCHFAANPRRIPFFASEQTLQYPFCFCILTRCPILSVHFQYLTYLVLLYNRVVNPDYSSRPPKEELKPTEAEGDSISYLTIEQNTGRWPDTRFPDVFARELLYFGSMKSLQNRDKTIMLTEPNTHANLTLTIPHIQPDYINIATPTLDVLFSCLSVDDIVKLYTALLLEHHTIFRSKQLHKLTMAVLAARTILTPFKVEATLLPIIPNDETFLPILESPVPYICGLVSTSAIGSLTLPDVVCIVDLDKQKVTDSVLSQTGLIVPHHKKLITNLNHLLQENASTIMTPPKKIERKGKTVSNPKYDEFFDEISSFMRPPIYLLTHPTKYVFNPPLVENILKLFSGHLVPELELKIKSCFVTDSTDISHPITVFNKDLFLASIEPSQQEFFDSFINTTLFQQYCEGKTDEMQVVKAMMSDNFASEYNSL